MKLKNKKIMEHLTYYVIVYNSIVESIDNEVEFLQYGTLEEMLSFLDECKKEYFAMGYFASIRTIQNGEEIDRQLISI